MAVDSITEKVTESIRRNINSLSGVKSNQILVEKTVSNSLRVPFVATVYPNAHFVHLVRDGRAVTESAMRQWKKKPDIRSLVTKFRQMPLGSFNYISWFVKNFVTGLFKGRGGGSIWGPRFPEIGDVIANKTLAEVCALQWAKSVTALSLIHI